MARPTDESNAETLPDPELNPLLNPLLAAHMGRWAEVYFTSPPEKRAQAVSELLRELANNPEPDVVSVPGSDEEYTYKARLSAEAPIMEAFAASMLPPLNCGSCGHRNLPLEKFCGMCGRPLTVASEDSSQQTAAVVTLANESSDESCTPRSEENNGREFNSTLGSDYGAEARSVSERLPWSQSQENSANFSVLSEYQTKPASRRYRVYAGLVLSILLALLVYRTWLSNPVSGSSGSMASSSTLPKAVTNSLPESQPSTSESGQPSPPSQAVPPSAPATSDRPNRRQTAAGLEDTRNRRQSPQRVSVPANSSIGTTEPNGSEELATAEKYLNATPGMARDSEQAAVWLWKAVAKQNLTATMLLSDLYLKGEGVTKSCDQARLLLDAAARKGGTAAAERLRNLQAFGCQ